MSFLAAQLEKPSQPPRQGKGKSALTNWFASDDEWSSEHAVVDSTTKATLPAAFQAALDKLPIVPTANVKIVLVLAYYRSGSTFLGELLSSGDRSYFHFEPLHPFTIAGSLRPGREPDAFQLLDELVRCRMVNVPLYTVWLENHPQFLPLNRFLADVCGGGESCFSPGPIGSLCSRAKTQVFKFTRLNARQVSHILFYVLKFIKFVQST